MSNALFDVLRKVTTAALLIAAALSVFVFVRIGPRMIAVLPDREVDLGRVDPQDNITVARRPGPAGVTYEVEVKKAS